MKVTIQRIHLVSLGKMGCLLGVVAAFLPSLACSLLGLALARVLLRWLGSWQELSVSVLGQEIARFDLVQFFGLQKALAYLQTLSTASYWGFLLVALLLALAAGVALAVIVVLVGLAYNLLAAATGGLIVEMAAVRESGAKADTAR